MKREQLLKILKVAIISTIVIFVAEGIFAIPGISNWFSKLITNSNGVMVWIVIWIIMFLQVTLLNIPAYVILSACASIKGLEILSITYILVVLSAYMCGCLLAYWLGYKFGKKAVKWCAGSDEDYAKWSSYLNKKGKLWYLLTVTFPFFPDDLLCLVAGAVRFDFGWYTLANFIGRGIGLITMILTLKLIGAVSGDFPIMLIIWAMALVAEIIFYYLIKSKHQKEMQEKEGLEKNKSEDQENDKKKLEAKKETENLDKKKESLKTKTKRNLKEKIKNN